MNTGSQNRFLLTSVCIALLSLSTVTKVAADSGKLNFHAEGAFGLPVSGDLRPSETSDPPLGFVGQLAVDWQAFAPFALEITGGAGQFFEAFPDKQDQRDNSFYINGAFGTRIRLFDDQNGYADEENGNLKGNLWISTHVGYHYFDGSQFGVDFGLGYEWSVAKPTNFGVFARATVLVAGNNDGVDTLFLFGANASFDLFGKAVPKEEEAAEEPCEAAPPPPEETAPESEEPVDPEPLEMDGNEESDLAPTDTTEEGDSSDGEAEDGSSDGETEESNPDASQEEATGDEASETETLE